MAVGHFELQRPVKLRRLYAILPCFFLFSTFIALTTKSKHFATSVSSENPGGRKLLEQVNNKTRQYLVRCIPSSINEFPGDFFTQEERLQGGVIIHILITLYTCAMVGFICDKYFVPSLEIICDSMKMPTDIAGATFMAIGTSAPELFSSIIGVFITEGDIGVGTIIGSAVFNILGVTSISGLALWKKNVPLDWFPITRDCLIYALTVATLTAILSNNVVMWWEALILIVLMLLYIFIMYFNSKIEKYCTDKMEKLRKQWKLYEDQKVLTEKTALLTNQMFNTEIKEAGTKLPSYNTNVAESVTGKAKIRSSRESQVIVDVRSVLKDEAGSLCSMPYGGAGKQILWVLMWPASLIFFFTIPDCQKLHIRKFFVVTFLSSVIWLGALSYLCIWMVTIIGYTFGIPDTVAGITILAAGTSVPEIISSILVVRNGYGNMAICNLIASNIYDILFCLGAPWLIKTAAFSTTGSLVINSSAMTYTTATLLSTVIVIYIIFQLSKWNLNWKVGIICLIVYAGFLILSCMYEFNVFEDLNPPLCKT